MQKSVGQIQAHSLEIECGLIHDPLQHEAVHCGDQGGRCELRIDGTELLPVYTHFEDVHQEAAVEALFRKPWALPAALGLIFLLMVLHVVIEYSMVN